MVTAAKFVEMQYGQLAHDTLHSMWSAVLVNEWASLFTFKLIMMPEYF